MQRIILVHVYRRSQGDSRGSNSQPVSYYIDELLDHLGSSQSVLFLALLILWHTTEVALCAILAREESLDMRVHSAHP